MQPPIYLDHHSTTPVDPMVLDAMLPWMRVPANPHSDHALGRDAAAAVDQAKQSLADDLQCDADQIVVTSGATESNNLALRGFCEHPRQKRRQIITLATEHPCVLDVVDVLSKSGFEVCHARVDSFGRVDLDHLRSICGDQTAIVSIAAANNEIGVVADLAAIADIAHRCGAVVHSDATQLIGRRAMSIRSTSVDLVSGSSHKFYGPRGCGFLIVGGGGRRVRLNPQIIGGGQQRGIRSGTVNVAAVVGMATALRRCLERMDRERVRLKDLRNQFWRQLSDQIQGLDDHSINGPPLDAADRLEANLNFKLATVEGEAWIAATPDVAFSSGSACSSVDPAPSHVLMAIGLDESAARRSVRFGLGRGNDSTQIDAAVQRLVEGWRRLRPQ